MPPEDCGALLAIVAILQDGGPARASLLRQIAVIRLAWTGEARL